MGGRKQEVERKQSLGRAGHSQYMIVTLYTRHKHKMQVYPHILTF